METSDSLFEKLAVIYSKDADVLLRPFTRSQCSQLCKAVHR